MPALPGQRLGLHPDTASGTWLTAFGQNITVRRGQPILSLAGALTSILPGYVRLTDRLDLTALDLFTTSTPYMLPDGYAGGWDSIPRSDEIELPKWTGGKLHRQVLTVTLNVHRWPGLDVEKEWAALEHMARPTAGKRPPALQLDGPVFHKGLAWTIIALEPATDDEGCIRTGDRLVRQDATITLQQFEEPTPAKLQRTAPAKDRNRIVHTTAALDTLSKVARKYMGDDKPATLTKIRKLNKGIGTNKHRKLYPPSIAITLPPKG